MKQPPSHSRLLFALTIFALCATLSTPPHNSLGNIYSGQSSDADTAGDSERVTSNWTAHLPVWQVGEKWVYDIVLDAREMVANSSDLEGAELDPLVGEATIEVMGVEERDVGGAITPVYRILTDAEVVGDGRDFPAPILGRVDGYLTSGFTLTEYLRVGDLALVEYDKEIQMSFTAEVAFVEQTVEVADFVESGAYTPPLEFYDYPMADNESWNIVTNLTKTYSGSSDVVSLPEQPEYFDQEWLFNINESGDGGYAGCENSTRVWQTNPDGEVEEWRWWCPAVNQYSRRWTNDIALSGVDADLQLTAYTTPTSSMFVEVVVQPESTPLNSEVDIVVNITDSFGNAVVGESGFIFLHGVTPLTFITDENGTSQVRMQVGNSMDDTPTADDWATHGIVAYLHADQSVGATTVTLEGSAIGGLLRIHANNLAYHASSTMASQSAMFEASVRY